MPFGDTELLPTLKNVSKNKNKYGCIVVYLHNLILEKKNRLQF